MKKLFLFLILMCTLAVSVAAEGTQFPMLIYGKVKFDGVVYAGQEVHVKNLRLGYTWTTITGPGGVYEFTFNNLYTNLHDKSVEGDALEIWVCPPEVNPDCKKTATVSTIPKDISWGIDDTNANLITPGAGPTTTISSTTTTQPPATTNGQSVNCGDCNLECPELVCPECNGQTCDPCIECVECPECEDCSEFEWIIGLIIGVVGVGAGGTATYFIRRHQAEVKGVGLKITYDSDGKKRIYHRHKGIRNYHDPHTQHIDKLERHPRDELLPEYVKDETGKWVYNA